jgi:hypothetical protein
VGDRSRFVSEEVKQLLITNGIPDLGAAFDVGRPVDDMHAERAVRHDFKRIVNLDLKTPDGVLRVFIKRQWRRERLLPRLTEIRHRIGIKCTPIHEWRGLRIMQRAGLNVSEPLALFWRGWGFSSGAIVTQAVPVNRSLDDLISNGEFERMDLERRNLLIKAVVSVVERLRRARLAWRSMKAKHFYPEETSSNGWRIWLIDCEGVSTRCSRTEHKRQWKAFLHNITERLPDTREAFLENYMALLSS